MSLPLSALVLLLLRAFCTSIQGPGCLALASLAHCGTADCVRSFAGSGRTHPHGMLLTQDITLRSLLDVEPKHVEQIQTLFSPPGY